MIRRTLLVVMLLTAIAPAGMAGERASLEETLQTAKNRLAGFEARKKAIDQLNTIQDPAVIPFFAKLVRDSKEPMALRGHVTEMLIESNNDWAALELKNLLNDSKASSESRGLALYALWRKNAQQMRAELMSLAQNPEESTDLRAAAIAFLSQSKGSWPPRFWLDLYSRQTNSAAVRIAALNGMKELGLLTEAKTALSQVIRNPHETAAVRKATLLSADSILPPQDFEQELISIISNPENSLEIRRFALDNLALRLNPALVPQLRQILSREKNPSFSDELETLIKTLTSKS